MGYLKAIPTMMFILGFWAMGNRQLFHNNLVPMEFASEPINPDHSVITDIPSPDLYLFFMLIFITLGIWGVKQLDLVEN